MRNPNLSEGEQHEIEALPTRRKIAAYHEGQATALMSLLARLSLLTLLSGFMLMIFAPEAQRQAPGLSIEQGGEMVLSVMAVGLLMLFAAYMYHALKSRSYE